MVVRSLIKRSARLHEKMAWHLAISTVFEYDEDEHLETVIIKEHVLGFLWRQV